jgi:hypothetical protein
LFGFAFDAGWNFFAGCESPPDGGLRFSISRQGGLHGYDYLNPSFLGTCNSPSQFI